MPKSHYHSSNQFMICLKPAIAREETVVIEIYEGPHYPHKPDCYMDERDAH